MIRNVVSPGLYQDEAGGYWSRPWILRRRTWRKLKAVKIKPAIKEAANASWQAITNNFHELARLYIESHCPNKRLEPRPKEFTAPEIKRVTTLQEFFGRFPCDEIRLPLLPRYKAWRCRELRQGTGERTVDKDLCTLSNVLNYGVAAGNIEINYIRNGRPRYRRAGDVRHSREVAPADGDQIHQLAAELFNDARSQVLGWQLLFQAFTGCRTSELLRLRIDAHTPDDAGYTSDGHLFLGRRSKFGINPWAMIGPEFADMLATFRRWHRKRFPKSPWYFPSPRHGGRSPVDLGALGHAITRISPGLKLHKITPHGIRSFYVTKRRSDGIADIIIAGEIGDKTISLMQTTYGARPANWTGGAAVTWLPKTGKPAWKLLQLDSPVDSRQKQKNRKTRVSY